LLKNGQSAERCGADAKSLMPKIDSYFCTSILKRDEFLHMGYFQCGGTEVELAKKCNKTESCRGFTRTGKMIPVSIDPLDYSGVQSFLPDSRCHSGRLYHGNPRLAMNLLTPHLWKNLQEAEKQYKDDPLRVINLLVESEFVDFLCVKDRYAPQPKKWYQIEF
jgi:hypothetical protein